jgi:cation diffusion facilitator CzcD-associated flavoprotein CzcO
MPVEHVETLIIGGGQAGLVMSHQLKQRGLPHLVLERQRIGERWRSERWDGLKFQFPNWSVRLPDFPFPHGAAMSRRRFRLRCRNRSWHDRGRQCRRRHRALPACGDTVFVAR